MAKYIFFDLDGTLTDPAVGITSSVKYALEHYGITIDDTSRLNKFIGPPLHESFERFFGFSHEQALEAVEIYREYFAPKGIFENKVYDGVEDLLSRLQADGYLLVIASSKPKIFVDKILHHFDLMKYFTATFGSELDGTRVKKDEVIEYALRTLSVSAADAVMIGDREHDMMGADKNGMTAIGVSYGYGSYDELKRTGAKYIVSRPCELYQIITKLNL